MSEKLKRGIKRIIQDVEEIEVTPEAEELLVEAVQEYCVKLAKESMKMAYYADRITLRGTDVELAVKNIR